VNCADPVSFFPEIYNEDWLFFYDDARDGKLGDSGFHATQLRYDPFGNPRRARQQEFGDVLAEGLYSLLHKDSGPDEATRDYWDEFIATRRSLLVDLKKRSVSVSPDVRGKMRGALDGATACLANIQPEACENYVRLWRKDRDKWRKRLSELPRGAAIDAALHDLGLKQAAGGTRPLAPAQGHDEPAPRVRRGPVLIQGVPLLMSVGTTLLARQDRVRQGLGRRRGCD
jgi:hypothetical protein